MKKINLNKKGFTLVELLAVIVVLAVIMLLAVNAVIPQMNKARRNAFVTEAQSFIDAAGTLYQNAMLTGGNYTYKSGGSDVSDSVTSSGGCINIAALMGEYIDKDDDNYKGSVKIEIGEDNKATYTIWLSNGQYIIDGATSAALASQGEAAASQYESTPASTSCGS